jgi:phosphonate transport system substrate-binding protein
MDELVFARMIKEGKLNASQVRVFYTTPPFFDYVWAARKGLDPDVAKAFANAMLSLAIGDAEQKHVLDLLSASKYVTAEDSSYDPLRQAAKDAGLLK